MNPPVLVARGAAEGNQVNFPEPGQICNPADGSQQRGLARGEMFLFIPRREAFPEMAQEEKMSLPEPCLQEKHAFPTCSAGRIPTLFPESTYLWSQCPDDGNST